MRKLLLSLGVLLGSQLIYSQTVLLDENFDSYTNFAISGFGGWTTLDLDGRNTYTGGTATATWPNANLPQAFMIFNPSAAGVTNNTTATLADDEVRNFDPIVVLNMPLVGMQYQVTGLPRIMIGL